MLQLSNGFVPSLRFPCLLLHHISPPKPWVTNVLLGDGQVKGKRGWRVLETGCIRATGPFREKKMQMSSAVSENQAPACSVGKEKGWSATAVALLWERLGQPPSRSVDGVRPCVAGPQTHHKLAWAGGGVGAWLPNLDWKRPADFSSMEIKARKEEGSREGKREAKLELGYWFSLGLIYILVYFT